LNHPFAKYDRQTGFIFPNFRGENKTYLKPATSDDTYRTCFFNDFHLKSHDENDEAALPHRPFAHGMYTPPLGPTESWKFNLTPSELHQDKRRLEGIFKMFRWPFFAVKNIAFQQFPTETQHFRWIWRVPHFETQLASRL